MLFLPVIAQAQVVVNEYDLVGKWVLESYSGEFNFNPSDYSYNEYSRPKEFELYPEEKVSWSVGNVTFRDDNYSTGYVDKKLFDYFISSNNPFILHFQFTEGDGIRLRFRIISYSNNVLELDTFDGKGHLIYKRDSSPDNSSGETGTSITGDVNGDGLINMMDVTEIINIILGK